MHINGKWVFILMFSMVLLLSCAGNSGRRFAYDSDRPEEYKRFFRQLGKVTRESGVGEASVFPVQGFPYLRTNRFLAAFQVRMRNAEQVAYWVEWMRRMDLEARRKEIQNLPPAALIDLSARLAVSLDREKLMAATARYSELMLAHDRRQAGFYAAVKNAAVAPSEYEPAMRVFGIYPLTSLPVASATRKAYDEFRAWHRKPLAEIETYGRLMTFKPPGFVNPGKEQTPDLFAPARKNPLAVNELSSDEIGQLVLAYAPVIVADVAAEYDRFGRVEWLNGKVSINTAYPTVYYYLSYSFIKAEPVLQINYSFWYTERAGALAPRIEHGPLDGVTVRVTLDDVGDPVMVDIMNNCGCYHFFVPRKETIVREIKDSSGLYPFVPAFMPSDFPEKPLQLRLNTGWHQVQKVFTSAIPREAVTYQLLPYEGLEALPYGKRLTASVFDARGIMKDSSRIEPVIFFGMGIPDVGYMRQRGHHAIKMVGKAHFTDPDLFNGNFEFR